MTADRFLWSRLAISEACFQRLNEPRPEGAVDGSPFSTSS